MALLRRNDLATVKIAAPHQSQLARRHAGNCYMVLVSATSVVEMLLHSGGFALVMLDSLICISTIEKTNLL